MIVRTLSCALFVGCLLYTVPCHAEVDVFPLSQESQLSQGSPYSTFTPEGGLVDQATWVRYSHRPRMQSSVYPPIRVVQQQPEPVVKKNVVKTRHVVKKQVAKATPAPVKNPVQEALATPVPAPKPVVAPKPEKVEVKQVAQPTDNVSASWIIRRNPPAAPAKTVKTVVESNTSSQPVIQQQQTDQATPTSAN